MPHMAVFQFEQFSLDEVQKVCTVKLKVAARVHGLIHVCSLSNASDYRFQAL